MEENLSVYAPSYFKNFKCIAGECSHNCCIGWEIDIDDCTCKKYESLQELKDRDLGNRFKNQIEVSKGSNGNALMPHFKLSEDERCPFLNSQNLCDIISVLGDSYLCQICSDHPRFRNFFETRTEIGLGLCCEAAADLIINNKENFKLKLMDSQYELEQNREEEEFYKLRQQIFDIISDDSWKFDERVENLFDFAGALSFGEFKAKIKTPTLVDVYLGLEQLDPLWSGYLKKIIGNNINIYEIHNDDYNKLNVTDMQLQQILTYFLYRHLAGTLYDGCIKERIEFSVISTYIIAAVSSVSGLDITEAARMYSSEIEYSDENVDALLGFLCGINSNI